MDSDPESGGTRIQRKPPQQVPQQVPPQNYQQQVPQQVSSQNYQQQVPPNYQPPQNYQQQVPQNYQQQIPQNFQQMPRKYEDEMQEPVKRIKKTNTKSTFSFGDMDISTFKYSILVVVIFIVLNSKIIWKQISRLPFMGQVEPSILALIVNSILSGVINLK